MGPNYFIITKENCPFCIKAVALLEANGLEFRKQEVGSLEEAREVLSSSNVVREIPAGYTSVPMIWAGSTWVGGFTELSDRLAPSKRTVFDQNSTGHITGHYPLFLGDSKGFADTINNPYPQLEKYFQTQQAFHWNEFEVDLTEDRQNMLTAPKGTVDLMVKTILWQSLVDSVAARSISGVLMDYVSNPTLEGLYNIIAYFESIHSRTYLHIIKQTFVDPNDSLTQGYQDMDIMGRSEVLRNAFDDLLNTPFDAPQRDKRKALYKALVAMYMLESLNFMASFAITFGIAETGIFQGISQNVSMICRDEMLHAKVGKSVLEIEMQEHPDIFEELKPQTDAIFWEIVNREHIWTDKLFSEGRYCPNINAERIKRYVNYAAGPVAETLDIDFSKHAVDSNPCSYMDDYTDSSNVQVAPQELQLSAYLVNSTTAISDKKALLKALAQYA